MIRFVAQLVLSLLANALGLLAASWLVDGFAIDTFSFVMVLVMFSLATTILGPLIAKIALTNAPFLMGGISLVTILVGLIVTTLFTDGLTIDGLGAWFVATFVIWVASLLGNVLLPLILFKKTLAKNRE